MKKIEEDGKERNPSPLPYPPTSQTPPNHWTENIKELASTIDIHKTVVYKSKAPRTTCSPP